MSLINHTACNGLSFDVTCVVSSKGTTYCAYGFTPTPAICQEKFMRDITCQLHADKGQGSRLTDEACTNWDRIESPLGGNLGPNYSLASLHESRNLLNVLLEIPLHKRRCPLLNHQTITNDWESNRTRRGQLKRADLSTVQENGYEIESDVSKKANFGLFVVKPSFLIS